MKMHQRDILKRIPTDRDIRGVEVGVWRGETSFALLSNRPNLYLYMIDPYRSGEPGTPWWESGSTMPSRPQEIYNAAFKLATNRTRAFSSRSQILRETSLNAVNSFEDKSLDFVFLDGDHSYDNVVKEISAWIPKIKDGGWIGGHDYNTTRNGKVKEAVNDTIPHPEEVTAGVGNTWFYYI